MSPSLVLLGWLQVLGSYKVLMPLNLFVAFLYCNEPLKILKYPTRNLLPTGEIQKVRMVFYFYYLFRKDAFLTSKLPNSSQKIRNLLGHLKTEYEKIGDFLIFSNVRYSENLVYSENLFSHRINCAFISQETYTLSRCIKYLVVFQNTLLG